MVRFKGTLLGIVWKWEQTSELYLFSNRKLVDRHSKPNKSNSMAWVNILSRINQVFKTVNKKRVVFLASCACPIFVIFCAISISLKTSLHDKTVIFCMDLVPWWKPKKLQIFAKTTLKTWLYEKDLGQYLLVSNTKTTICWFVIISGQLLTLNCTCHRFFKTCDRSYYEIEVIF